MGDRSDLNCEGTKPVRRCADYFVEYKALREEILCRLRERTALTAFVGTASAVLLAAGFTKGHYDVFLVVPAVGALLGVFVAGTVRRINRIGNYIRTKIEPRVVDDASEPLLGWEASFNRSERWLSLLLLEHIPVLGVSLVPSLLALFQWYDVRWQGASSTLRTFFVVDWVLLAITVVVLLVVVVYPEVRKRARPHTSPPSGTASV